MTNNRGSERRLRSSCHVNAAPRRVFDAWTTPAELMKWWGPQGVHCVDASIDLRVGGEYRIANELPDKTVLWITGTFETVDIPDRLVYSWRTSEETSHDERVCVSFDAEDNGTRVTVTHERIASRRLRDQHDVGWSGCLRGLAAHLGQQPGSAPVDGAAPGPGSSGADNLPGPDDHGTNPR